MSATLIRTLKGRTADGSFLKDLYFAFTINEQCQVIEVRNFDFEKYKPEELYSVRQNVVLGELKKCDADLRELRSKFLRKQDGDTNARLQARLSKVLERRAKLEQDDSIVQMKGIKPEKKKREKIGGVYID